MVSLGACSLRLLALFQMNLRVVQTSKCDVQTKACMHMQLNFNKQLYIYNNNIYYHIEVFNAMILIT